MSKKRRRFTESFKAKVALEAVRETSTLSELASKYQVHPNQVSAWKKQLIHQAPELFSRNNSLASKEEEKLIATLYEEIGRLKMDIRWLEKKL